MNLYLIERTDQNDYDETVAIVAAYDTEQEAREYGPFSTLYTPTFDRSTLKITYLGVADSSIEKGLILEDFAAE